MAASANDLAREAIRILDARVFPVDVYCDNGGKWHKVPLTPHGHHDGNRDPDAFEPWRWARANAVGIRTGSGLYVHDIDDASGDGPPARWLKAHGIHPSDRGGTTRVHETPSGGLHMLFRTAEPHLDLRTRASIVPGLDSRGAGGWLAFGPMYGVVHDRPLAFLPPKACSELHQGAKRAAALSRPAVIEEPERTSSTEVTKWQDRGFKLCRFRALWTGAHVSRNDTSRSGADWHLALLLAALGAP